MSELKDAADKNISVCNSFYVFHNNSGFHQNDNFLFRNYKLYLLLPKKPLMPSKKLTMKRWRVCETL